jgi:uncharacterized protein YggL (DUF469 family)
MKNKQTMKQLVALLVIVCVGCSSSENDKLVLVKNSTEKISEELLALERKWLEAEFKLDTAYISTLIDSTFNIFPPNKRNSMECVATFLPCEATTFF